MPATIAGIATALPAHRIPQADAAEHRPRVLVRVRGAGAHLRGDLPPLRRRDAAQRGARGLVGPRPGRPAVVLSADPARRPRQRMREYEEHAGPLATRRPARPWPMPASGRVGVTHLVTVSCSGFAAPGVDHALIRRLGLPAEVARTHVGFMGCHGLLNGLRVATGVCRRPTRRPASCSCAVELCSLHYPVRLGLRADRGQRRSSPTERRRWSICPARGAERSRPLHHPRRRLDAAAGLRRCHVVADRRSRLHDDALAAGARLIGQHVRPWLSGWLARHGLSIESIGSWAVHPGGPRDPVRLRRGRRARTAGTRASFRVLAESREHVLADRRLHPSSSCATPVPRGRASPSASGPASPSRPYCSADRRLH